MVMFLEIFSYFNESLIANIVSLRETIQAYRVTMNSTSNNAIMVHTPEAVYTFKCCTSNGLYYINMSNIDEHKTNNHNVTPYLYYSLNRLNIANENKNSSTTKK